jgi:hypothetical protein
MAQWLREHASILGYSRFPLIFGIFLLYTSTENTHRYNYTYTYSSSCVLHFLFAARKANFSQVSLTTQKVEEACRSD